MFAVQRVPFAVQRVLFAVQRVPFAVQRVPFAVQRVPFAVQRVPFAVQRAAFCKSRFRLLLKKNKISVLATNQYEHQIQLNSKHDNPDYSFGSSQDIIKHDNPGVKTVLKSFKTPKIKRGRLKTF